MLYEQQQMRSDFEAFTISELIELYECVLLSIDIVSIAKYVRGIIDSRRCHRIRKVAKHRRKFGLKS